MLVYALSFWHYPLYWWAYRRGTMAPARFRHAAVALKTVALAALAYAYLGAPWHGPSAVVVAAGFLLNALAARALGSVRTYYGWELGEVTHLTVTAFPYSLTPHPMLLGNITAYAGTLLNPEFRDGWWPLAALHVAFNAALLVMETRVTPLSGQARPIQSDTPARRPSSLWKETA